MKKITKFSLIGVGLLVSAGILSSCTASFCSLEDTAKILYTMERGVTRYYDEKPTDVPASEIKEHKIGELTYYSHSDIKNSKILRTTIVPKLVEQNYFVPPMEFFELVDNWVLEEATKGFESTITSVGEISVENTAEDGTKYYTTNYDTNTLYGVLNKNGYKKFFTAPLPEEKEIPLFTTLKNRRMEKRSCFSINRSR